MNKKERETREFDMNFQESFFFWGGGGWGVRTQASYAWVNGARMF